MGCFLQCLLTYPYSIQNLIGRGYRSLAIYTASRRVLYKKRLGFGVEFPYNAAQYLLMGMGRHHRRLSDTPRPLWDLGQVVVNRAHIDTKSCMWQRVQPASVPEAD